MAAGGLYIPSRRGGLLSCGSGAGVGGHGGLHAGTALLTGGGHKAMAHQQPPCPSNRRAGLVVCAPQRGSLFHSPWQALLFSEALPLPGAAGAAGAAAAGATDSSASSPSSRRRQSSSSSGRCSCAWNGSSMPASLVASAAGVGPAAAAAAPPGAAPVRGCSRGGDRRWRGHIWRRRARSRAQAGGPRPREGGPGGRVLGIRGPRPRPPRPPEQCEQAVLDWGGAEGGAAGRGGRCPRRALLLPQGKGAAASPSAPGRLPAAIAGAPAGAPAAARLFPSSRCSRCRVAALGLAYA